MRFICFLSRSSTTPLIFYVTPSVQTQYSVLNTSLYFFLLIMYHLFKVKHRYNTLNKKYVLNSSFLWNKWDFGNIFSFIAEQFLRNQFHDTHNLRVQFSESWFNIFGFNISIFNVENDPRVNVYEMWKFFAATEKL